MTLSPTNPISLQCAAARSTDPATSHEAAKRANKSGSAETQCRECHAALERWPGSTSDELAQHMGADRYMVAKRLPVLRNKFGLARNGATRPSRVSGNDAMTWWPVPPGV